MPDFVACTHRSISGHTIMHGGACLAEVVDPSAHRRLSQAHSNGMQDSGASETTKAGGELQQFGKYHLIASLGQGGMANVYLALLSGPADFNKLLVIKIMRHDALAGSADGARMFWAEARLAALLLHPNIVHTHEVGELDGRIFMAMEFLDGQPLTAILNRARADRDVPLAELVRVISEVARGLHYAHQLKDFNGRPLGVVHRDVSPHNIIVTYEGHGKLVDFGIAKTQDGDQTQLGLVKGKIDYIAPEQLRSEAVDARADVFALGAILWEIVTGQRFAGGRKVTDVVKVQARLSAGERRLRAVRPEVDADLEQIIERSLALDPGERFQDAAAFADALDAFLEHQKSRPNARALSKRLHGLFEVERQQMHALIERQIQRVAKLKNGELISNDATSTDARKKLPSGFGLYVADTHIEERSSIRTAAAARASTWAPEGLAKVSSSWKFMGAVLLAASFALFFASRATERSTPLEAAPRPAPAAIVPPAPVEPPRLVAPEAPLPNEVPATIRVHIRATPLEASVLLDGVKVAAPFEGSFRRDSALHHVEVVAPGYRSAKEFVAFDRDREVSIQLERASSTNRGARLDALVQRAEQSAVPEAPVPTNVPSSASAPTAPKRHDVAEDPNPYAGE